MTWYLNEYNAQHWAYGPAYIMRADDRLHALKHFWRPFGQ